MWCSDSDSDRPYGIKRMLYRYNILLEGWGVQQQHDNIRSTDIIDVRNRVLSLLIFVVYRWFPLSRFFLQGTIVMELNGSKVKCYGT